jgi:ribonuclease BN (tRNA processing enzyme)
MSLTLTVLGCNGSGPAPDAPASGYFVQSATTTLWMDAGTGTFMRLADIMDPAALDAVAISHLHADHCADLFGLIHYVLYRTGRPEQLPVFVPPGAVGKIAAFLDADDDHPLWSVFAFDEVEDGGVRHVGDMTLLFAATTHSVPTNAIRVESEGASLVFSGDTGPGGGFPWLAHGAAVVLAEAALSGNRDEGAYPYHLSGAEVGQIAKEAGASRLIVTHLAPTLPEAEIVEQAAAVFEGPTEGATPGLRISID